MAALTAAGSLRVFSVRGRRPRRRPRLRRPPNWRGTSPTARDLLLDAYASDGPAAAASPGMRRLSSTRTEASRACPVSVIPALPAGRPATWDAQRAHTIARRGSPAGRGQGAIPRAPRPVLLGESCLLAGDRCRAVAERREIKSATADFCRTGEVAAPAWRGEERASGRGRH